MDLALSTPISATIPAPALPDIKTQENNINNPTLITLDNNMYSFYCPHCSEGIEVESTQVNCRIFRHGAFFTKTPDNIIIPTTQINPHSSKEECDRLVENNLIIGCGKPFELVPVNGGYNVRICEYK